MRLLVCTPDDPPSANMKDALLSFGGWEDVGIEESIQYHIKNQDLLATISGRHIFSEGLDEIVEKAGYSVDEVVFMSRHAAASGRPTLTVHPFGNYGNADYGGKAGTLSPAAPESMTYSLRRIFSLNTNPDYEVSFEVTHHGPLLSTPGYFIEVGSAPEQWGDVEAAEVLASVLSEKGKAGGPRVIGIGGGHYAPRFTEIALRYDISMGHMVPNYQLQGCDNQEIASRITKAFEASNASCIYLHKKSMKKTEENNIRQIIERLGYDIVSSDDLEELRCGS